MFCTLSVGVWFVNPLHSWEWAYMDRAKLKWFLQNYYTTVEDTTVHLTQD
jgi:hypothetical protein